MSALDWDSQGQRNYETGIDHGVLYVGSSPGVIWPGLISVSESPNGGDVTPYYVDGVIHLTSAGPSDFQATIAAFSSPEEFDACEGIGTLGGMLLTNQPKKSFGLSYRTTIGNDLAGPDYGYKIHMVYNALAKTPSKEYSTISDSNNPMSLSWDMIAKPIHIPGLKPTAHFELDSTEMDPVKLALLEAILYGDSDTAPHLPTMAELADIFDSPVPDDDPDRVFDGGGVTPLFDIVDSGGP